jgi:non-ribosomal peptide synthetase component F
MTDANRSDPAFMQTIGLMLDSLPLWFRDLNGNEIFADRFTATRDTIYAALGNSGVPLDAILEDAGVENNATHMPLFQVLVNYRMGALAQESVGDDIKLDYLAYDDARHPFDFILTIDEKDGRGALTLSMQDYLYDQGAAKLFVDTYVHFLDVFSSAPEIDIGSPTRYPESLTAKAVSLGIGPELVALPAAEKEIGDVSGTGNSETLTSKIERTAQLYGDDVALKDATGEYTYRKLLGHVDSIIAALVEGGVTKGTRVGVFGQPSANVVFCILAILRSGAVYVPLDERNSDERLAAIVSESNLKLIIGDKENKHRIPVLVSSSKPGTVGFLDPSTVHPTLGQNRSPDKSAPVDIAFIMFTSGSTGKPKGIMLNHRNMLVHVLSATQRLELGRETVLQQSSLGYDASLAQIFYALANGGRLIFSNNRGEMGTMAELIRREAVSLTLMAPSEYALLMQYGHADLKMCKAWKFAMVGGEAFPSRLRLDFRRLGLAKLGVWNAYGELTA